MGSDLCTQIWASNGYTPMVSSQPNTDQPMVHGKSPALGNWAAWESYICPLCCLRVRPLLVRKTTKCDYQTKSSGCCNNSYICDPSSHFISDAPYNTWSTQSQWKHLGDPYCFSLINHVETTQLLTKFFQLGLEFVLGKDQLWTHFSAPFKVFTFEGRQYSSSSF